MKTTNQSKVQTDQKNKKPKNAGEGTRGLSIGIKIYLSIAILIFISLAMAVSTSTMVDTISGNTKTLVHKSLPQILKGTVLEKQSSSLISSARALTRAESAKEIKTINTQAFQTIEILSKTIAGMDIPKEEQDQLTKEIKEVSKVIPKLKKNALKRLETLKMLDEKTTEIKGIQKQVLSDAAPLFDDSEFNLMISLSDLNGVGPIDLKKASTEIEANIQTLSNTLRFTSEINMLVGYYNLASQLNEKEGMVPIRELYTSSISRLKRIVEKLNVDLVAKNTKKLIAIGDTKNSVFSLREDYLDDLKKSDELTAHLEKVLGKFQADIEHGVTVVEDGAVEEGEGALKQAQNIQSMVMVLAVILIVAAFAINWFYVKPVIVKRLIAVYHITEKIAKGDLDVEIKNFGTDELGKMSEALVLFRDNAKERIKLEEEQKEQEKRQAEDRKQTMMMMADQFEQQVGAIVTAVANAAQGMQDMTGQLSTAIDNSSEKSNSVATAATQASQNVQTVSAAAEQMSASIREISSNIQNTVNTSQSCAAAAKESQNKLDQLSGAVEEIDAVIQSINDVAEQTNLLALNATIEAARAGEAGKGFAVVANEVKSLANETHNMTSEISGKVEHIKTSADETIRSVNDILKQIDLVDAQTTSVASAVEEQDASTAEITRNISEASQGTQSVSNNIQDIQQAANQSSEATRNLKDEVDQLAQQSDKLQVAVHEFLAEVRSA